MPLSPEDRIRNGRHGGYAAAARRDSREATANARQKFNQRFYQEVDPNNELPEPERDKRAKAARKAHFVRLAQKSARVRKLRRQAVDADAELQAELVEAGLFDAGDDRSSRRVLSDSEIEAFEQLLDEYTSRGR